MTCNKVLHLTLTERKIIETGRSHGSTKAAIVTITVNSKTTADNAMPST